MATFGEVGQKWAQALAAADRITTSLWLLAAVTHGDADAPAGPGCLSLEGLVVTASRAAGIVLVVDAGAHLGLLVHDHATSIALADVLAGHRPPTSGVVRLDGADLADVDPASARRRVVVAEHDAFLFAGTLTENLAVSGVADRARQLDALAVVAAADVVSGIGLDGHIAERGRSVSGGQRQRIALARALLADPDVLVLQEPTSAVDAHTEAVIAGRLPGARRGRTTVVLTHSPALLAALDEVVVIADGVVAARGTHAALMVEDEDYRSAVAPAERTVSR